MILSPEVLKDLKLSLGTRLYPAKSVSMLACVTLTIYFEILLTVENGVNFPEGPCKRTEVGKLISMETFSSPRAPVEFSKLALLK